MPTSKEFGRAGATKSKATTLNAVSRAIDEQPELNDDIAKLLIKKGVVADFRERDEFFVEIPERRKPPLVKDPPIVFEPPVIFNPPVVLPQPPIILNPPTTTPTQPANPPTNIEIDTRLQILINSIPIANPGNLITSEYHNALREAVRGLASRIGLSVSATAEFKIFTFAPNFLPMKAKTADGSQPWTVTLERATTPEIKAPNLKQTVMGGFVVQLPDGATVYQMIARGSRAAGGANPKEFKISLRRQKFGANQEAQTLISMDLKEIKEGAFEDKESVQLSDEDLKVIDEDSGVAGATVGNRKIVNNQKWIYTVAAEYLASENAPAEKVEIHSIQILCAV
jgi:hypothetical protein